MVFLEPLPGGIIGRTPGGGMGYPGGGIPGGNPIGGIPFDDSIEQKGLVVR